MDSTSSSEMDSNSLLSDAMSNVDMLRQMQFQCKNRCGHKKGSHGLQAKVVKWKLYHLPEASPVPTIGIKQGRVKQHMDPGGCSSVSKVTPPVSIKSLRKGIKLAKS